jgi:hypothetical protein
MPKCYVELKIRLLVLCCHTTHFTIIPEMRPYLKGARDSIETLVPINKQNFKRLVCKSINEPFRIKYYREES